MDKKAVPSGVSWECLHSSPVTIGPFVAAHETETAGLRKSANLPDGNYQMRKIYAASLTQANVSVKRAGWTPMTIPVMAAK